MRVSILTIILVTSILFFSYAAPLDNESSKPAYLPPAITAIADAGPDTTLTCVVNTVTLEGMNTSMGPEFIYEWTDEFGNVIGTDPAVDVFEAGEFILSVTNTNTSFEDMDTTIVTFNQEQVEFSIIDPENLSCILSSVLIDLVLDDPNANAEFAWEGPSGGVLSSEEDLVATQAGTYTVIVTDVENGCSAQESVFVEEDFSAPIVVTNVQQELTCDNTVVLLEGDTDAQNASFEWTNSAGNVVSTNQNAEVSEPGIYILTVTNENNGCIASSQVEVLSNQEEETINVPTITSSAASITLDAEDFVSPSPGSTFEWATAAGMVFSTTPQVEIVEEGVYVCTVTNPTNGCVTAIIIYNVDFITTFVADAGPDQTLSCNNQSVTIGGANSPTTANFTFEWMDDSFVIIGNQIIVEVDLPGVYTLTVTNIVTGESTSDEVSVFIDQNIPNVSIDSPEILTCENSTTILDASGSTQGPNIMHLWTSMDGNILSDPSQINIEVKYLNRFLF